VRINQLDPQQYGSDQEYNTWAYSACSAAAMTEVINAYTSPHHTYRITDILQKEIALGEISSDLGMLHGETSIERTVAEFGFKAANVGAKPSLDDVLAVANTGKPVIIGFPPETWAGGHVLVLRGSNAKDIYLTDSSKLNMQTMDRQTFQRYWRGFAVVVEPV
jgi:ABC-type bacteriocin/lantibiotic exporter with double-glycine peptidase domain